MSKGGVSSLMRRKAASILWDGRSAGRRAQGKGAKDLRQTYKRPGLRPHPEGVLSAPGTGGSEGPGRPCSTAGESVLGAPQKESSPLPLILS